MNNIKWKDGAVCFAGGKQYSDVFVPVAVMAKDFQLNEIRQGDCIPESELNTEQKYNDAVEVFRLFGFYKLYMYDEISGVIAYLTADEDGKIRPKNINDPSCQRKITYLQLMAIGKLKRAMLERDSELEYSNRVIDSGCYDLNSKRNKSKQAYEILKSLDYDYDLDKQKWFKKHYI